PSRYAGQAESFRYSRTCAATRSSQWTNLRAVQRRRPRKAANHCRRIESYRLMLGGCTRVFFHGNDRIHIRGMNLLLCAARPLNLDPISLLQAPQTKVDTKVGARSVATTAYHVNTLSDTTRHQKNLRTDRIARAALAAHQP